MYKQWEKEPWRIEHADDATITFTIAVHGKHAWEMLLEDSRHYHSISHGWATDDPRHWDDTIAPLLRRFFAKGRLEASQCTETYVADVPKERMPEPRGMIGVLTEVRTSNLTAGQNLIVRAQPIC